MKNELISYEYVQLRVQDLKVSTEFWEKVIGLLVRSSSDSKVEIGTSEKTIIVLEAGATQPFKNGYSGLYHVAIHVPTEADLALLLRRFQAYNWPVSPTDHIMSKALYVQDPDGITIEITLETPGRFLKYAMDDRRFAVIDSEGNVRGASEQLDVEAVLKHLQTFDITKKLPKETFLGHVHLYVADLQKSYDFYKSLGFRENIIATELGFADLSAGGIFKHRIAMNTWQSYGMGQAPSTSAGMIEFAITYASNELLEKFLATYIDKDKDVTDNRITDPSGNLIVIRK